MSQARVRTPLVAVVFDGQSFNLLPGPLNGGYPVTLMNTYFPTIAWSNVSIGAMSWTKLSATATHRCYVHGNDGLTTVLIMNGGTNDITSEADSGATLYADQGAYATAAKAAGFDLIICLTLTKANSMSGTEDTNRLNNNTLVIADASNYFDGVVQVAEDSRMSDPTDTTYFSDGVHWTAAGCAVVAGLTQPVLSALL